MKLIRYTLLLLTLYLGASPVFGQRRPHIPGQVLVSLAPGAQPESLLQHFRSGFPATPLSPLRQVSAGMNIWLLETSPEQEAQTLSWLRAQPEVQLAQFNHLLEKRLSPPDLVPNDSLFYLQWQLVNNGSGGGTPNADFDADLAWNITTGGVTPLGDTIVVAVIDGGIEYNHPDLAPNMWKNRLEIPGDGLDNDGNGYIDDYLGWNVYDNNDNITGLATGHGTPVTALIGAKGDNTTGVAGINWDVKLMFVAGNDEEAAILAAYDYVLNARKRYNASNGQQGAFVVAVNCSWGVDKGKPQDAPLWCAAFDSLGRAGILGIAATANQPWDVDVAGDLPTACPSDYLIAVTSLTKTDQKASNAAWGQQNIDLGAYGKDVFTAGPGGSYGLFIGTSFAAPQVSGAVGLLYSAPCFNLIDMAKADPGAAALRVKELILNTVTPNADLQNKTVTGGRLNLNNLVQGYENQCAICLTPFSIRVDQVTTQEATIRWGVVTDVQSVNLRWRKLGDMTWTLVSMISQPYLLGNLSACTDYEIALRGSCGGASVSAWSAPITFRTDGCCSPPSSATFSGITNTTALLNWNTLVAGKAYAISLQPTAGGAVQEFMANQNTLSLSGLTRCTEYQVTIKTLCDNENSPYSTPFIFRTAGCGACTDKTYCPAEGNSTDEWISGVEIGTWSNFSTGGPAYQNFTDSSLIHQLILEPGVTQPLTLTPAFAGLPYKEYFKIYIDYNADGDFDDPDELAFDPGYASDAQITGEITPPNFSGSGFTRMRVLMKYNSPIETPPLPCEKFNFGQVEDYCAHLGPMVPVSTPFYPVSSIRVYPQPASDWVYLQTAGLPEGPVRLLARDAVGRVVLNEKRLLGKTPLALDLHAWPDGVYLLDLESEGYVWQQKVLKIR